MRKVPWLAGQAKSSPEDPNLFFGFTAVFLFLSSFLSFGIGSQFLPAPKPSKRFMPTHRAPLFMRRYLQRALLGEVTVQEPNRNLHKKYSLISARIPY